MRTGARLGDAVVVTTAGLPTVVIADDDRGVRDALSKLIDAHPGLEVVGVAESGFEATELCERLRPSAAVVDVMMPGGGCEAIIAIRAVSPRTAVVVYTARSDRRTRERMMEAGAILVIVKGDENDLAMEIERIAVPGPAVELESGSSDG